MANNELSREAMVVTGTALAGDGRILITVGRVAPNQYGGGGGGAYGPPPIIGGTQQFSVEKGSAPSVGEEVEVTVTRKGK